MERQRINMWVPTHILKEVDKYQVKNGIATRTAAFLELVRKGLEKEKEEKQEQKDS